MEPQIHNSFRVAIDFSIKNDEIYNFLRVILIFLSFRPRVSTKYDKSYYLFIKPALHLNLILSVF